MVPDETPAAIVLATKTPDPCQPIKWEDYSGFFGVPEPITPMKGCEATSGNAFPERHEEKIDSYITRRFFNARLGSVENFREDYFRWGFTENGLGISVTFDSAKVKLPIDLHLGKKYDIVAKISKRDVYWYYSEKMRKYIAAVDLFGEIVEIEDVDALCDNARQGRVVPDGLSNIDYNYRITTFGRDNEGKKMLFGGSKPEGTKPAGANSFTVETWKNGQLNEENFGGGSSIDFGNKYCVVGYWAKREIINGFNVLKEYKSQPVYKPISDVTWIPWDDDSFLDCEQAFLPDTKKAEITIDIGWWTTKYKHHNEPGRIGGQYVNNEKCRIPLALMRGFGTMNLRYEDVVSATWMLNGIVVLHANGMIHYEVSEIAVGKHRIVLDIVYSNGKTLRLERTFEITDDLKIEQK